jgi:hypothetical protein
MIRRAVQCAVMVVLCVTSWNIATAAACPTQDNSSQMLEFLKLPLNTPDQLSQNAQCISEYISALRLHGSPEAIQVLLAYLDFPRPLTEAEKKGYLTHAPTPSDRYPAVGTLLVYGKQSGSFLVEAIKSAKTDTSLRNATYALGSIYGEAPEVGMRMLSKAMNTASKEQRSRLESSATQFIKQRCAQHEDACKSALKTNQEISH